MRSHARREGKPSPELDVLAGMLQSALARGAVCQCCLSQVFPMTVGPTKEYGLKLSVSLQHWGDGSVGFIHHRCNCMLGRLSVSMTEASAVQYLRLVGDAQLLGRPYPRWCPGCKQFFMSDDLGHWYPSLLGHGVRGASCKDCVNARTDKRRLTIAALPA